MQEKHLLFRNSIGNRRMCTYQFWRKWEEKQILACTKRNCNRYFCLIQYFLWRQWCFWNKSLCRIRIPNRAFSAFNWKYGRVTTRVSLQFHEKFVCDVVTRLVQCFVWSFISLQYLHDKNKTKNENSMFSIHSARKDVQRFEDWPISK